MTMNDESNGFLIKLLLGGHRESLLNNNDGAPRGREDKKNIKLQSDTAKQRSGVFDVSLFQYFLPLKLFRNFGTKQKNGRAIRAKKYRKGLVELYCFRRKISGNEEDRYFATVRTKWRSYRIFLAFLCNVSFNVKPKTAQIQTSSMLNHG